MKKNIFILFIVFLFCGCSTGTKEVSDTLSLTERQIENFNNIINEQLQLCLWNYNQDSNNFVKGSVETSESTRYQDIYQASLDMGYNINKYAGYDAVIASTPLTHFNNEDAGDAYFYFVGNELVCEYYISDGKVYSLKSINTFTKDKEIPNIENINKTIEFEETEINPSFSDFEDIDSKYGYIAVINNQKLKFFSYKNNFKLEKEISFTNEGLYPMDIKFTQDGKSAVLLGKKDEVYNQNNTHANEETADIDVVEHDDTNDIFTTTKKESYKAVKIVFLDRYFNKTSEEIPLDLSIYTSLIYDENAVFVGREKSIDMYEEQNGTWTKINQFMLNHWVSNIDVFDIDNDNNKELIVIDGMDIYIYEFNSTLELMWKTNLSFKSMAENLYIADLNQDGVNEIYIHDLFNTTVRYVLCKNGFESYSNGIGYGHKYIPGDFNNDGKDDYILMNTLENTAKLFIAK